MAIFIGQSSHSYATARYFSGALLNQRVFKSISADETGDFCTCLKQCIPNLPAFTDEIGIDFYKNDKFAIFINTITDGTIRLTLIKEGAPDVLMTDNTYGVYTNDVISNFFRFELSFFKVWDAFGYGNYSFKVENLSGTDVIQSITSPKFTLKKYSSKSANRTVRIETSQGGILQHGTRYVNKLNLNQRFSQQVRLYGSLTLSAQTIENTSLQLNNDARSQIQIKDQLSPEYTLNLHLLGSKQANFILLDYLFANAVNVSDYNVYNYVFDPRSPNANFYRSIPLKRTSTDFAETRTKLRKTFSVKMEYNNKNVFKINP